MDNCLFMLAMKKPDSRKTAGLYYFS